MNFSPNLIADVSCWPVVLVKPRGRYASLCFSTFKLFVPLSWRLHRLSQAATDYHLICALHQSQMRPSWHIPTSFIPHLSPLLFPPRSASLSLPPPEGTFHISC